MLLHLRGPLLACVLLLSPVVAQAQTTYTWNGGVGGVWSTGGGGWLDPGNTPTNWSNSTSLVAAFTGTPPTSVIIDIGGVTAYGLSFTADGYSVTGGTLTLADPSGVGGTVGTIAVGSGFTATINAAVAGAAALTKTDGGTLVLGSANSYTGGTLVSGGTLTLAGPATLGAVGTALRVSNGATLNLGGTTQVVGTVNASGAGNGVNGTISNGTLNLNGNNMYLMSGTVTADLTGGGQSRLWIGGDAAATVNLGGINTVTYADNHSTIIGHPTTGNAGTVRLITPTGLGPASQEAQLFTGTIDFNGQTGITLGNLAFYSGGNSRLVNNSTVSTATHTGTIEVRAAGTSFGGPGNITVAGVVFGGGGFEKSGIGTLTLQNTLSTYSGVTILSGGILNAANLSDYGTAGALGNRAAASEGGQNIGLLFRSGTLQYTGSTPQSTNRAIRLSTTGGGGTIDASGVNSAATLSFTAVSSPDFWENGGTRTLTLTGSNTGANTFTMQIADIAGVTQTGVTKTGPGTWVLNGANNYRGPTLINNGILRIQNATALGVGGFDGTTKTDVAGTGTLEIDGSFTIGEHFHFGGSGAGGIGAVRVVSGSTTLTTSGAFDDNGTGTAVINVQTGASLTFGGVMYSDAQAGLTKTGGGTLVLGAANVYPVGTTINGGRVQIATTNAVPASGIVRLGGGTLSSGTGFNDAMGTLNVNGTGTIELGASSHTLNFAAFDPANFSSLTVTGWTGTPGASGTQGHITFTDASNLTGGVLANINFTGFGPGAVLIGGNEIVPAAVPEPLGLVAVGFAGLLLRRRLASRKV